MGDISQEIFRAYDIRGEIGKDFIPRNAYYIGLGIGTQLSEPKMILLGRDARLTSPEIAALLTKGLLETGCQVIDLGIIPTPALYFALSHLKMKNGLMVTASHNPANHNGIKMVMDNVPLSAEGIQQLYQVVKTKQFAINTLRQREVIYKSILPHYLDAILDDITLKRRLRVGIDCCNGVSSLVAESLYHQLGCDVFPLYCELDGTFPNHSPDPTQPKSLEALQQLVCEEQLDLGIAFDGDADRMIAVDGTGKILWPDRIMILLATSILKQHPAACIAFDVKCSYLLPKAIRQAGGNPSMCVSGHSLLKFHMAEIKAIMGGEFSGHIILNDRWSCFDDALYNAARLLEILSGSDQSPTQCFDSIPDSYSTPEYHLLFANAHRTKNIMKRIIQHAKFPAATLNLIDGLRVDYDDCWGLVRVSNTTPSLSFRFEAQTPQRLDDIQQDFRALLKGVGVNQLPF